MAVRVLMNPDQKNSLQESCGICEGKILTAGGRGLGNGKEPGLPPGAVVLFLCPPCCVGLSACAAMEEMDWGAVGEEELIQVKSCPLK